MALPWPPYSRNIHPRLHVHSDCSTYELAPQTPTTRLSTCSTLNIHGYTSTLSPASILNEIRNPFERPYHNADLVNAMNPTLLGLVMNEAGTLGIPPRQENVIGSDNWIDASSCSDFSYMSAEDGIYSGAENEGTIVGTAYMPRPFAPIVGPSEFFAGVREPEFTASSVHELPNVRPMVSLDIEISQRSIPPDWSLFNIHALIPPPIRHPTPTTMEGLQLATATSCPKSTYPDMKNKQHSCDICSKSFTYPRDLQRHLCKHTKSDPTISRYHCSVSGCPREKLGFLRKDKLQSHIKKVHKGRSHYCTVPGCKRIEGFKTEPDLQRHKTSLHILTKGAYQCPTKHCRKKDKKWTRLDNFRTHLKRQHGLQDDEELKGMIESSVIASPAQVLDTT